MTEEKCVLVFTEYERRLMIRGMVEFRNAILREGKPIEDVNTLILKIIDAPHQRKKRREERERR